MNAPATISDLLVAFRRAVECGDDTTAESLAVRIDEIQGAPVEDDRMPEPLPCWGCDA
jgi:hypothetical protein